MEELVNILWKSCLSLILFYGFHKVLLQNETFFKSIRYFLLLGIFTSFLIPFLVIPKYIEMNTVTTSITANISAVELENTIATIHWNQLLFGSYIIITLFSIIRLILQVISITNLIRRGNIHKEANINYVETTKNVSPFSFFNYIVYNPKQFSTSELDQILRHEKVHVQQKHSIDNLVASLLTSVQWFNPFAWLYKKEMCQNLEYSADLAAVIRNHESQSYQKLLLKTSVPDYQIALANNFYNSLLKKRIIMLQQQRSNNSSQWKFTMIIPLLIAFIFAFNVKTIAQQKKIKIIEEKVNLFALIIDNTSTKENLAEITSKFKAKGLNVKFKSIKRNNGKITSISIDAQAKNGKASASYATDKKEGIDPIQISFDSENSNLNIGSTSHHDMHSYTMTGNGNKEIMVKRGNSKGKHTRVTKNGTSTVYVHVNSDDEYEDTEEIIIKGEDGKEVTKEIIKIRTKKGGDKNNFVFISSDDDIAPLYILDGKEISKKEMEALDADSIESMNVYKGTKAIEKYGNKGKDGVIVITSKKK